MTDTQTADVLLVEDNSGDIRRTREALESGETDLRLHVARDGVEALQFLGRHSEYPSLPDPPVIVLTSSEASSDVIRSSELSANAYLTSPVSPDGFIETVQQFESFCLSTATPPIAGG